MVANKTTMKFCPMVECGKLTPHSYDDGSKQVECDGACSVSRQVNWRSSVTDNKQPTKTNRHKPCITIPHVAGSDNAWDCEAHGNEMSCPCGCGETMCEHVSDDDPRICPESGIVDCATEHCSIHGHY
jgi:hypothetical protein